MTNEESVVESVNVNYGGAEITVDLLTPPGARLTINRITRASEMVRPPNVVRLSSTVQTDYEWHEFIEAVIDFKGDEIYIAINANNQRIAEERFAVEAP